MEHPVQVLASTKEHIVTASYTKLSVFDAATNAPIASSSNHKALVRLLATFTDDATKKAYLISTGEDKLLEVSSLPDLQLLSSRDLPKRANALEVTATGDIVVGDKFGDVYIFPLDAPTVPADAKPEDLPKPQPILGHVSMLNTLALIPADPAHGLMRDWIATGDRDEHVRISRFPAGHVIEKFAWGSKRLVSSLLYLPAPSSSSAPPSPAYLLSAGADPSIQVFELPSAELVSRFPIEDIVSAYISVHPEAPTPVPAGRRKNKQGTKKSKGKQFSEGGEPAEQADTTATPEPETIAEERAEGLAVHGAELAKGLAIVKMLEVGTTREDGGVIVLVAGSTALLYIPFSLLLPTHPAAPVTTDAAPSLLRAAHPILDFVPTPIPASAESQCEFLVSLDHSRTPSLPTAASNLDQPHTPLMRVSLGKNGQLKALPTLTTDSVLFAWAYAQQPENAKQPSVASLYPVLSLLHHPGDEEFAEGGGEDDEAPRVSRKVGRGAKRAAPGSLDAPSEAGDGEGGARRVGKRATGRAETLRRYEEAKRKLEAGGETAQTLTEGEKAAVKEMEEEAEAAAAAEGAEMEGAHVA
ncbi:tRNA guanine-N7-methyltransferase subunit TRM82 [Rhodotorula toruloides]|uniref:tRNA guanine-N7-methyltransferase subunit TRM82 n=1 Tax=Rhodotorula toruloides TaxID=5286 RepID=A0A511KEZ3_RHOTO|nr:tRNA guanine-N7-methyltransferase subunit TRM82 [Rhodotorula toruloides]